MSPLTAGLVLSLIFLRKVARGVPPVPCSSRCSTTLPLLPALGPRINLAAAMVVLMRPPPVPGDQDQVVRPEPDQLLQAVRVALLHLLQRAPLADLLQAGSCSHSLYQTPLESIGGEIGTWFGGMYCSRILARNSPSSPWWTTPSPASRSWREAD